MTLLDFKSIEEELFSHGEWKSFNVLVRTGKWSGRGQIPAVLFLTKDALFYGGCHATHGKFHRISRKSISKACIVGRMFLKCIEVEYLGAAGARKIFMCPFSGEPHQPSLELAELHNLYNALKVPAK